MTAENMRSVVTLMGFASRIPPDEVAAHIRKISSLAQDATNFVSHQFAATLAHDARRPKQVKGRGYLHAGYRDVAGILLPQVRSLSENDAREVIAHPKTTHTLAMLALRSTHELSTLIRNNYQTDAVAVHEDGYLDVLRPGHLVMNTSGENFCPYAGQPGNPSPVAVFSAFARHAAEVAYLADCRDRERPLRKFGEKVLPIIFNDPYYGIRGLYG